MKYLIVVMAVVCIVSCSSERGRTLDDIFNSTFRVYQISGYDGPKIDIRKDSLTQFLVALHYDIPMPEIESSLAWSAETTKENIEILIKNKLLTKKGTYYQPAMGIITSERGNAMEEKAQQVAHEIADSIISRLPEIKRIHDESHISKRHDFRDLSLFYLSNVILDNFQIQQVEEKFLNQERPLRNGSRYYLAIVEDDKVRETEPYGIYGNRGLLWNDSIGISVFGNKRLKSNVGWDNYQDKNIHVFDAHDTELISSTMPEAFLPTLLDVLNRNKPHFEDIYRELNFENEITFEEFFIFWYHWIYTETTDILVEKDIIWLPQNEMFYYQRAVNF